MNYFTCIALLAGVAIGIQAGMNSQLGVLLKNPLLSAGVAFVVASVSVLLVVAITARALPSFIHVQSIPVHLWFSGVISSFGVASFYFLIPRLGIGSTMSYALAGQLLFAVLASHFGWFDLPVKSINLSKCFGVIAMITGIVLINRS